MAVAASRDGVRERRCHAGLSALISPTTTMQGNELAVLSTCMFVSGSRAQSWKQARERGFIENALSLFESSLELWRELGDQTAIARALDLAGPGDLVLLTGKGSEQAIMGPNGTSTPWDERQAVRDLLRLRLSRR